MRHVVNTDMGILGKGDPPDVWENIIRYIPDEVLLMSGVRILVVAAGYGTEADMLVQRMKKLGKTDQEIKDSIYVLDKYKTFTNVFVEKGYTNVIESDFLDWIKINKMKFDVIIGNPPFNENKENKKDVKTPAGVSGKTALYKDFILAIPNLIKDGGIAAFITPKGIVRTLHEHPILKNYDVIDFNLMSEKYYWPYDTCYFVLQQSEKRTKVLNPSDNVLSKVLDLTFVDNFQATVINKSDAEFVREKIFGSGQRVIRYLPGKRGEAPTYDYVNTDKYVIDSGPKVVGTILNSVKSITATEDAVCAGTTIAYRTDTLDEAEALALFLKNNKVFKYFQKKTNVKKMMHKLTWFKKFDLTQITTGCEYPREWNLTPEEIEYIEKVMK